MLLLRPPPRGFTEQRRPPLPFGSEAQRCFCEYKSRSSGGGFGGSSNLTLSRQFRLSTQFYVMWVRCLRVHFW